MCLLQNNIDKFEKVEERIQIPLNKRRRSTVQNQTMTSRSDTSPFRLMFPGLTVANVIDLFGQTLQAAVRH